VPARAVQEAFVEFEKNSVRVPKAQNDRAKRVHPEVRSAVEKGLGELFMRAFLAGSYARRVQTVRLKDIDIIIVLDDSGGAFAASAGAALERLREAAKSCDLVERTRKGVRAVQCDIKGEEFTVDLVAARDHPLGEMLLARWLPGEGLDDWTHARPQGQLDAAVEKNRTTNGVFIPAVRIIKYWNRRAGKSGKNAMPSYLAESILYHALAAECDYADAVLAFFEQAKHHLGLSGPSVRCPGDPGNYVDDLLEDDRRKTALAKVKADLAHAEEAVAESDSGKAMDCWVKVFGPAFPAPSGDTSSLAAALNSGSAVAKGAGITTGAIGGRQVIPARGWRGS
jgi:hypothetical protein